MAKQFPGTQLGIHTHNDTENAVANSLAAIRPVCGRCRARLTGLGERCGNANLVSLIPTLLLKPSFADRFETGINLQNLPQVKNISLLLDDILNRTPDRHAPYVGASAFAHKGGIHVSAVMKDPSTYEHVAPDSVGNNRVILVSDQAGKSNVLDRLTTAGIAVDAKDPAVDRILREVKTRELDGYSYDGVGASFELLALAQFDRLPAFFDVAGYTVNISNQGGDKTASSQACHW